MSDQLDLHRASAAERTQAFRNVYEVWPSASDPEEHLERRLANPKFDNATWYVGTLAGRVVTACGCYQVSVSVDGAVEPSFAVGSVHTLPEFRGKGFAPRLVVFAEAQERSLGKTFCLLYSDIGPAYYERLGYRVCRASQGWVNPAESTEGLEPSALIRLSAGDEMPTLSDLYAGGHTRYSLTIARSADYWRYLLNQNPLDEFYFVSAGSRHVGYVRLGIRPERIVIRDVSLLEDTDAAERGVYSAVIALAKARGAAQVGGWMPADPVCRELFAVTDRVKELTMIKPLVDRIKIVDRHCQAAAHFHEIDHV
jgi:predicted N-acetyltransferase YhbS